MPFSRGRTLRAVGRRGGMGQSDSPDTGSYEGDEGDTDTSGTYQQTTSTTSAGSYQAGTSSSGSYGNYVSQAAAAAAALAKGVPISQLLGAPSNPNYRPGPVVGVNTSGNMSGILMIGLIGGGLFLLSKHKKKD